MICDLVREADRLTATARADIPNQRRIYTALAPVELGSSRHSWLSGRERAGREGGEDEDACCHGCAHELTEVRDAETNTITVASRDRVRLYTARSPATIPLRHSDYGGAPETRLALILPEAKIEVCAPVVRKCKIHHAQLTQRHSASMFIHQLHKERAGTAQK